MRRTLETALAASVFLLILMAFLTFSISITKGLGLSSADDGFFALASKALVTGRGYGLPSSSFVMNSFDPSVGVGPGLIVPGAWATYIAGPSDRLGSLTTLVFLIQLLALGYILLRTYAASSVLLSLSGCIVLLVAASARFWPFSTFIGEAPALGYVMLGATCLALGKTRRWIATAGVVFSLAFLTKQIALFSIAGISAFWLLQRLQRQGMGSTSRQLLVLAIAFLVLPLAFEFSKLALLGWDGYMDLWQRTAEETRRMALGNGGLILRIGTLREIFTTLYWPWTLVVMTPTFFVASAWISNQARPMPEGLALSALLISGAAVHFLYIALGSTLFGRYVWLGMGLICCASALAGLSAGPRTRWVMLLATFGVACLAQPVLPLKGLQGHAATGLAEERAAVLQMMAAHDTLPLAGRSWHSFYDLIYLRMPEGEWVTESDLHLIQGRDFIAVLNSEFGEQAHFHHAVMAACPPIYTGKRYMLAKCDAAFWARYAVDQ